MSLLGATTDASGARVFLVADGIYLAGQSDVNHDAVYDAANNCLAAAPGSTGTGSVGVRTLFSASANVNLVASTVLPVSTASAAVTLTINALTLRSGMVLCVVDVGGAAATRAITVALAGTNRFEDGASSKQITTNYGRAAWIVDKLRAPNIFLSTETL